MYVHDHEHQTTPVSVHGPVELVAHLRSTRNGPYGSFILWHGTTPHDVTGPALFVHINNDMAYLWFVADPNGDHPGFQPTGMSPANCSGSVHFMQTDGIETDGI